MLDIAAGQSLSEHEVHERAWVVLVAGEIQAMAAGDRAAGVTRALIEFAPEERDQVLASSDAQLLTCGLMLPSERGKAVPRPAMGSRSLSPAPCRPLSRERAAGR